MKIDETFITKIKLERNLQSVLNNLIVLARTVAQIQEHLGIDNETKPEKEAAGV